MKRELSALMALAVVWGGLWVTKAHAAPLADGTVIGVDFGPTAPSNTFNHAAGANGSIASCGMIDTAGGSVDDVGFSWVGGGASDASLIESELPGQPAVFDDSNLTDWLITVGGSGLITLTFTNLNDTLKYDVLIGSGFGDDNPNCTWTADGQSETTDANVGADAFVTLTNLSTDGSGNLVITSAGVAPRTDISVVSALTLTAFTPPPITLSSLAAGSITTNSALLSAQLDGTNANVTVYWEAGVVAEPAAHIGWDGTNGPAAESPGQVQQSVDGLVADTLYSYAFYATNATLGTGTWSRVATFATALTDAQAPLITNATARSAVSIVLGWQNNASNLSGFLLQRSETGAGGPYATIATPAPTATSYTDSGLSASTPYHYQLAATNSANGSATRFSLAQTNATTLPEFPIADGTVIGVDFGPTAPVNNFNQYNSTAAGTIVAGSLVDTSDVVIAGVSLTVSAPAMWSNNDAADSTDLPGQPAFFDDTHLTDWIGESTAGVDIDLTFSGLDDVLTYELVIGSAFINNATITDTEWTVDGQTATSQHDAGANAYVTIPYLETDGSGNLVITSDPAAGSHPNLTVVSALKLTASTPPPINPLFPAAGNIGTNSATLSVVLRGTNADVTVYWEAGAVADAAAHNGWGGTNGPAAAIPGTVQRTAVGLVEDTLYSYAFLATNATLGTSVWSAVETFATGLTDAQAPGFTNVTVVSSLAIALGWQNHASNLTGFVLQRSDAGAGGPYTTIATPGPTATSYTDYGLSASTTYHYQLAATNSSNGSVTAFSLTNATTTGGTPLADGRVIGIDIGTTTTPDWNNIISPIQTIAAGSVVDTRGAVVEGVSIVADIGEGGAVGGSAWPGWNEFPAGSLPDVPESASADFSFANGGGDHNLAIRGLVTGATYDIAVITQTGTAVVRVDTVTVTGASVTNSIIPRYVAGGAVDSSYEGLYHSFTKVAPSAEGSIAINTVDNAGNPSINAVRIEVVSIFPPTGMVILLR